MPDQQIAMAASGHTHVSIGRCHAHDRVALLSSILAPHRMLTLHIVTLTPPELQMLISRRDYDVFLSSSTTATTI